MGKRKSPKQKSGKHIDRMTSLINMITAILTLASAIITLAKRLERKGGGGKPPLLSKIA